MKNPLIIESISAVAHVRREQISSDVLERISGTEELELAIDSRRAALMSATELLKRGKIYSIKQLNEMLDDEDDDTNECVKEELREILGELEQYHYFWLI